MILSIIYVKFPCELQIPRLFLRCSNVSHMMSITMVFLSNISSHMSAIDMVFCTKVPGHMLSVNMIFLHVSILGHMSSIGMVFRHVILVKSRECQQDFPLYFFSSLEKIQKFRLFHLRKLSGRWSIPISFNFRIVLVRPSSCYLGFFMHDYFVSI